MNQLDYNSFLLLKRTAERLAKVGKQSKTNDWYKLTYPIFKNAPVNSIDDFWKIVAYTYSWMPRIPTIKGGEIKNKDVLVARLQRLQKGDSENLRLLLKELIPVINNSLTGTSKVLHFIAPEKIPIIDSNVKEGWNAFFNNHPEFCMSEFSKYTVNINSKIDHYLTYKSYLDQWIINSNGRVSLRDLELAFFKIGQANNHRTPKSTASINE